MSNTESPLSPDVSFFTNCYEGDWKRVLLENRLELMIQRCNVRFKEKVLIINNVYDRDLVTKHAQQAVENKIIDAYYFSEDYADQILPTFSITRKSFYRGNYDGYWYSMGPLSAVYFCKSKYLLYFTCDCILPENSTSNWINSAIDKFNADSTVLIANPVWNNNVEEARTESFKEEDNWFYSLSFSDQCFLVETARLYGDVYNFYHQLSERFPLYAGNLFEKRVDSFINSQQLTRITSNHAYYIHEKLINQDFVASDNNQPAKKGLKMMIGGVLHKIRKFIG
ncbi:hypothetical protein ACVW0P_003616 [Mucilaginibacter sp. UYNi724]